MREPPTAPRLPIVGNALSLAKDPLAFLQGMRHTHGDVVNVRIGPLRTTLIHDPDLVLDILVTRNRLWQKDFYLQTTLKPVLGNGLLASEGDFWRKQRRLAQPAFHRERIAAYGDEMVEHASRLARRWADGAVRDIHQDMMELTLGIASQTLFGANVRAGEVGRALEDCIAVVSDPLELVFPVLQRFPTPNRVRFNRAVKKLDAIVYGLIDERMKAGDTAMTSDLLSMLLQARDEDGSRMPRTQLRDECLTILLAGHETTAINLSWTWYLLSQHPEVKRKFLEELDEVLGDRPATFADVPNLRYTGHVISESLRLYPPAWSMGREAIDDLELGGYRIARGVNVWFCPWSIQRDRRWFDEPNTFRPERWEGDLAKQLHRYAYFPFGGGPRFCIGQAFAQLEAVLVLATLARSFDIDVLPHPRVIAVPSVTLRPKHGIHARLRRRRALA